MLVMVWLEILLPGVLDKGSHFSFRGWLSNSLVLVLNVGVLSVFCCFKLSRQSTLYNCF